jgi:hypothetical protein
LPKKSLVILGEKQNFTATGKDQFGSDFSNETITYTVEGGGAVMNGNVFAPESAGDYMVIATFGNISDTAFVSVKNIAEINLAYLKPVSASSYENVGTLPEYVNDGELTTRWGSTFSDPQTIEIDLLDVYKINKINLFWETAYATKYKIEISTNEDDWTEIYAENNGSGGTKNLVFEPTEARFVRLTTLGRATLYGAIIFEIEIYGTEKISAPSVVENKDFYDNISIYNRYKTLIVKAQNIQEISVYNTNGILILNYLLKEKENYFEKDINLPSGIYIVKVKTAEGKKIAKIKAS